VGPRPMAKTLHGRIDYARGGAATRAVRLLWMSRAFHDLRELRPRSAVLQLRVSGRRAPRATEPGQPAISGVSGRTGGTPEMPTAIPGAAGIASVTDQPWVSLSTPVEATSPVPRACVVYGAKGRRVDTTPSLPGEWRRRRRLKRFAHLRRLQKRASSRPPRDESMALNPVVIAEALSPSTEAFDRGGRRPSTGRALLCGSIC
jgi:hypothetical protein